MPVRRHVVGPPSLRRKPAGCSLLTEVGQGAAPCAAGVGRRALVLGRAALPLHDLREPMSWGPASPAAGCRIHRARRLDCRKRTRRPPPIRPAPWAASPQVSPTRDPSGCRRVSPTRSIGASCPGSSMDARRGPVYLPPSPLAPSGPGSPDPLPLGSGSSMLHRMARRRSSIEGTARPVFSVAWKIFRRPAQDGGRVRVRQLFWGCEGNGRPPL